MPDSPKDTTNQPIQPSNDGGAVAGRDDPDRDVPQPEPQPADTILDSTSHPVSKSPDTIFARDPGHVAAGNDDQNDSEAETEKLSEPDNDDDEDSVVKAEGSDHEDAHTGDRKGPRTPLRDTTPKVNGLKSPSEESRDDDRSTTARQHDNHRRKSSGTMSNAPSWSGSAHSKQDVRPSPSDAQSPPSRTHKTQSPSGERARSNSLNDSRKRKLRDEPHTRALEPPRQKHKSEGATRDSVNSRQQPTSPATAQQFRQHRRSASTQSAVQAIQGRKRRDTSSLVIQTQDPKEFSEYSSDEDSSPRRPQQPKSQHARLKRSSHRSLTSPARAMPPKKDTDRFGATKLAREAERGDIDQVKAAYDEKPDDLDRADFAGIAPLQKAALNGHAAVVKFLIQKGCKTNCQSENRDTPLIDAVENGHIEVVRLLLREGKVNPHHQNKKGQRAIDVLNTEDEDYDALEKELKDAMLRETDTSANVEPDAAPSQNKQSSSLLYNEYNTETLKDKAAEGNARLVEELLNSNIKPNIACGVAAARGGHHDILNVFLGIGLKPDPDPLKHSDTYMIVAIGRGHVKVIELLLKQESFDPTRLTRDKLTYWELAEKRHGPKWEQEKKILKAAYDDYLAKKGQSPSRTRKQARSSANSSPQTRIKRRTSPRPSDRSPSPVSIKSRRVVHEKSASTSDPPKRNRIMTGKEISTQKRRRRVVEEESSSDDDVSSRRPTKKVATILRAASEGEELPSKSTVQKRLGGREKSANDQGSLHATSEDSGTDNPKKSIKTSVKQRHSAEPSNSLSSRKSQPTPTASSDAESRRRSKGASVTRIKSERPESPAILPNIAKNLDTSSPARERTPVPMEPSRTPTPVRDERLAEARKKEEDARREAEEARLKEEEARRKEEEENRRLEEEKRLQQLAEERRIAKEQAAAARIARLQTLPLALKCACEKGLDRPLHFEKDIFGITQNFFPIHLFPGSDIDPTLSPDDPWMLSFQAVGVLGLPELDIALAFPAWPTRPVTQRQRDRFFSYYDVAALAQHQRFLMEGMPGYDEATIQSALQDTRDKSRSMSPLHWIRFADFEHELRHGGLANGAAPTNSDAPAANGITEQTPEPEPTAEVLLSRARAEKVRDMLRKIKIRTTRHIRIREPEVEVNGVNGDGHHGVNGVVVKPKKSFIDLVMSPS